MPSDSAIVAPSQTDSFGKEISDAILNVRQPYYVVRDNSSGLTGLKLPHETKDNGLRSTTRALNFLGMLAPIYPEWLGDRRFAEAHGCRFPYIVGEMARGLATPDMVSKAAQTGFLGFFGAAGLPPSATADALREIRQKASGLPWGSNLIHTPNEPALESALVDLYLGENIHRISTSAFMGLTPEVVRYACRGLHTDQAGSIRRKNHIFAKVSRPEIAAQFMAPAPPQIVASLVSSGQITATEAELAQHIPVANDVTAEADSGGHTDNRPLAVLLPLMLQERDRVVKRYRHPCSIRIGAAGGLGTPSAVAAAFALGAAYVLTGTVNQTAVESGLSEAGRRMLAEAGMADVAMAPSGDMFELGVKVQVLSRGSLYASRASRLYSLYRSHSSLEEIPADDKRWLEHDVFRQSLPEIENEVARYFNKTAPSEWTHALSDAHHRMALVFRWYLGLSSRWPVTGEASRRSDYQIWCGPAIGAFNAWVRGSFLQDLQNRSVGQIGLNLLEGAAVATRAQQARAHGIDVSSSMFNTPPRRLH